MKFVSLVGEAGLLPMFIGILLMAFAITRRRGACIFGSVLCGAAITNLFLKNVIARPRPFHTGFAEYIEWWESVGAVVVSEFSFPSGHVTAAMAGATAIFITSKKKGIAATVFLYPLVMAMSRVYLVAHYASDVIAAMFAGALAGIASYVIVRGIYRIIEKNSEKKFFRFVLDFDVRGLFCKNEPTEK